MSLRFDLATAVTRRGDGAFEARLDRGYWITVGPNGGYIAAILLRALEAAVGDPARTPRSLAVHYTEPGHEGPVQIATRIERAGRSVSTLSARMEQDGRLVALALAAFGVRRESDVFHDLRMPEVPAPETLPTRVTDATPVSLRQRFETRPVPHAPGVGGWIRPAEPVRADFCVLAALADSWPPSVHARPGIGRRGVPTVDLTVHFRNAPRPDAAPDAWYLCSFRSQTAAEGYVEEDGEIWSRDGVLLAQSRQLAVLR